MSTNDSSPTISHSVGVLLRGAWSASEGIRPRLFLFMGLFILAYTLDLLTPWALGYMLGALVSGGATPESLATANLALMGYLGLRLAYYACHHLARYIQQTSSFLAKMQVMQHFFTRILSLPLNWQVQHHSGEKLNRLHRAAGAVDAAIGTYTWQFIEGVTKLLFATVAIFALDALVAFSVVGMGLITVLMIVFFNRKLVRAVRENNHFFDRMNQIVVDFFANIITVKSLNIEPHAKQYLDQQRAQGAAINRRILRLSEAKWASVGLGYTMVIGIALLIYLRNHPGLQGALEVTQIYVLLNYLDRIFQAVGSFTAYYSGVIESATAYEDAAKIEQAVTALVPTSVAPTLPLWNEIEVRDVYFSYGGGSADPLVVPSLRFRRGEKIALVGPSGGGKSTLLKVLSGIVIPEQGHLLVDKTQLSLSALYANTLILPQEPEVFSETMLFNMQLGEEFTQGELDFFASLCRLEDVINKIPGRWQGALAESGMNLSLGERQRIAVARGLLRARRKNLLLLDEPTSSLDPVNEKQLFHGVLHHFADRTVITACHRLALVPLFDRIIFLKRGKIVEQGTFNELLALGGEFTYAWDRYREKIFGASGQEAPR